MWKKSTIFNIFSNTVLNKNKAKVLDDGNANHCISNFASHQHNHYFLNLILLYLKKTTWMSVIKVKERYNFISNSNSLSMR